MHDKNDKNDYIYKPRIVHPQNENVLIYSPSCHYKHLWLGFVEHNIYFLPKIILTDLEWHVSKNKINVDKCITKLLKRNN